jgi:GntR family transcriptional regulator of arabinose operon
MTGGERVICALLNKIPPFKVRGKLPKHNGYRVLKEHVLDWINANAPAVGSHFPSDEQLVRMCGLSRMTVRKAIGELQEEGWITRQQGRGSFVGLRVAVPADAIGNRSAVKSVRVAVLVRYLSELEYDWYSVPILRGISGAAEKQQISVELLGDHEGRTENLIRRLALSAPDVLIALAPQGLNHWRVIAEAMRLGIKVLRSGYASPDFSVPVVCSDGVDSSTRAVRYLVEKGHRKIAFIQIMQPEPWIADRYFGWKKGLEESGVGCDEQLALWLCSKGSTPRAETVWQEEAPDPEHAVAIQRFLKLHKPTAVLFGSYWTLRSLAPLVKKKSLRIPRDLSIISSDQYPDQKTWLGGVEPTCMHLPLVAMGTKLAEYARSLHEGIEVPFRTLLPVDFVEGESVASKLNSNKR